MFDPAAIQGAPALPKRPGTLSLLAQIWLRPRRALLAIAEGPGWLWLVPVLLALALVTARVFVSAPLVAQAQRAKTQVMIEANLSNMPEDTRSTLPPEATQVPEPPKAFTLGIPLMLGLGGIVLGWLVRAGVLQVVSMALGGRQGFGVVYRVSAWASFPLILRDAVQTIYVMVSHTTIDHPGLSGLLPAKPAAAGGLPGMMSAARPTVSTIMLGRIDLYTIWYLILLGIAVIAAGKLSRGKAAVVVGSYALLSLATGLVTLLTSGLSGGF